MIDLTPLDVRKKRGDFRRAMRGYEPADVDSFLEMIAERMEALVKENLALKEEHGSLEDEVKEARKRERAVQDALVTATALSHDMTGKAEREADLLRREAETTVERLLIEAEGRLDQIRTAIETLDRSRKRFLKSFRILLEQEMGTLREEEGRDPLKGLTLDIEGFGSFVPHAVAEEDGGGAGSEGASGEDGGEATPPTREPRYHVSLGRDTPVEPGGNAGGDG